MGLDRLFQADHEDGSLDQMLLSPAPLELIVLVKCVAHWFITGLPLVMLSPLFGLMLDLDGPALQAVAATLLVGTPTFTFLGAIGAAITVTLRRGGLLLSILVVPLAVPVLIFGVSAARSGTVPFLTPFLVLCALGTRIRRSRPNRRSRSTSRRGRVTSACSEKGLLRGCRRGTTPRASEAKTA